MSFCLMLLRARVGESIAVAIVAILPPIRIDIVTATRKRLQACAREQ